MSEYPMTRRDTRVRFSFNHGTPQPTGSHPESDQGHPRRGSFPILEPEPVHSPRAHDPPFARSRRATWTQEGPFSPPQGYIQNPNFNGQWDRSGNGSNFHPHARRMPPGNRFDPDGTSDIGPLDPVPVRSEDDGQDGGYDSNTHTPRIPPERPPANPVSYGPPVQSDETLYDDGIELDRFAKSPGTPRDSSFNPVPGYPAPPQTVLRSAMRRSYSEDFSAPTAARGGSGSALEAGPGEHRENKGTFSNLMHSYGLARGQSRASDGTISTGIDSRYQSQAVSRANSNESTGALLRLRRMRRASSALSLGGETMLDDDDPRITGVKPNRIDDEKKARETFKDSLKLDKNMKDPCIVLNINSVYDFAEFAYALWI
jgi:hypothetical protein